MPLTAIIVGAGIAGLSTAIALRQANFEVLVLESGNTARSAGQAIGIPSNASHILLSFGMDLKATRPCAWRSVDLVKADEEPMRCLVQQINPKEEGSAPSFFVHRRDYLEALREFAVREDGAGEAVEVRYNCFVSSFDTTANAVVLESGERIQADLLVAADGVRSRAHRWVVQEERPAEFTGVVAIRFTISTDSILQNPETAPVLAISENDTATMYISADPNGARVLRYPCRDGLLQNFGVFTSIDPKNDPSTFWTGRSMKQVASELLSGMNKSIASIPAMADENEVYLWKVFDRDPLPNLTKGSLVLIGDACHPMQPNLGQGAAQAVEDAGVLGIVLKDVMSPDQIPARLKIWEELRKVRVGSAQVLSRATLSPNPWASEANLERAQEFMRPLEVPTKPADLVSYFIAGDQLEVAGKFMSDQLKLSAS